MRHLKPFLAGLATVLVLAGCSGGSGEPGRSQQVFAALKNVVATRFARKPERPVLTRAVLDTISDPLLEATIERRDQQAFLVASASRLDDLPGRIVQWRTEDNVTLSLRNGMLIATRGIGGDLLSSEVRVASGVTGPASSGEKRHYVRARDNKAVPVTLACSLVDLGPETITIVGRAHRTRHLQERCRADTGQVTNDYWIDSRAGLIWQSRQWAGPVIGYLRLRRLTN